MDKFFNTAGPCRPDRHYMLPAAERLPEVQRLVDQEAYFVIHAPRQTGKTTAIRALAEDLTSSGRYAALAFSCQSGSAAGDDYRAAQRSILDEISLSAERWLPAELRPPEWPGSSELRLRAGLMAWATRCPRPLVLFFDEIDALTGQSLIMVLSQLRTGFNERPEAFPSSVGLCGMRDVRDYKAASGGPERSDQWTQPSRLGTSSPFNVAVRSLRLGDFSLDELATLYGRHTEATGQIFTEDGIEYAYELTQGQPWLVNALAREVIEEMGVPASESIGPRRLETAKERLIQARATHLDSLAAKLKEPRVSRVMEPLLAGTMFVPDQYDDDIQYVHDLGLVALNPPLRVANPIYREVIVRVLGSEMEQTIAAEPRSFVLPDGRLDFDRLLSEFVGWWKANGDVLTRVDAYHEAAPQLVLMAFLHRVVNGGGYVDREYGVGRGRIDLVVRWPYELDAKRVFQREAIELKVWRPGKPDPLQDGLAQLDDYLDRLDLDTGTLVLFDRRPEALPICERVHFATDKTPSGRAVTLLRA